jgi:hypothetical protein
MKFPDKLTATGGAEKYTTGEATERFVSIAETRQEAWAIQAALANIAIIALQSGTPLDPEDARVLVDYIRTNESQQPRLTIDSEQAVRLARLIHQGAPSVMSEVLHNQFDPRQNGEGVEMDDEELTRTAIAAANSIKEEAEVRKFRNGLNDFLDFPEET